ncbi:hypothetical protein QLX67_08505, partial [Balneolaceae bacterium ANBcel3]|nr:hypothetical protein [Balneolaceae bacterium ANBcel3]
GAANVANDGRLFIRGGDASEARMYIDGMLVSNPYSASVPNLPARTRFQPGLFKGAFFSTGGYSAEYGQALSSVLVLNSIDWPRREQTDVHFSSVGAGGRTTIVGDGRALTIAGDYVNLYPYHHVFSEQDIWDKSPENKNVNASYRRQIGRAGLLKVYAHGESGQARIWQEIPGSNSGPEQYGMDNDYGLLQSTYRYAGEKSVITAGISYSENREAANAGTSSAHHRNRTLHAKSTIIYLLSDNHSLNSGAELEVTSFRQRLYGSDRQRLSRKYQDEHYFIWSEMESSVTPSISVRSGLRWGYSRLTGDHWVLPRVSAAWRPGTRGQWSVAAGRYHQMAVPNIRVAAPLLEGAESEHLLVNYFFQKEGRTIRVEGFYKTYRQLPLFEGTEYQPHTIRADGRGFARGADVFYRDRVSVRNTEFWATYQWIDSKRSTGNHVDRITPSFAPEHNASLVIKHFIRPLRSQLGLTFSWNNGYPYMSPNDPENTSLRTSSFFDISVGWSYLPRSNMIVHLASSNIFGRDHVFGYRYADQSDASGFIPSLPVQSVTPRFLYAGIFITFSGGNAANMFNNF